MDDATLKNRGIEAPNDYASLHGETYCGGVTEESKHYPRHCLHGSGDFVACCWCGDVFHNDDESVIDETTHGDNFHELTPREVEVLQQVAEGLTNKRAAKKLNVAETTVHFHLLNASKKLGARNRTSAVVEALRRGIIQ